MDIKAIVMKVAAIQLASSPDKDRNLEKALRFAEAAVQRGAEILCFPELFPYPWFPCKVQEQAFSLAEPADGPLISEFCDFSKRRGVSLIVPFFEREEESYYNSAAVISGGELIGLYRKVHLPEIPLWEERFYFSPGNDFPVFALNGVKIGIQMSWDSLFPEGPRILALKGAEVLFVPTACAFRTQQRWLKLLAGHAISNGLFVVRVNRVGEEPHQHFYGMSFLLDPEGELILEPAGLEEGILLGEVRPEEARRIRTKWCLFKDRRPDLYRGLSS